MFLYIEIDMRYVRTVIFKALKLSLKLIHDTWVLTQYITYLSLRICFYLVVIYYILFYVLIELNFCCVFIYFYLLLLFVFLVILKTTSSSAMHNYTS